LGAKGRLLEMKTNALTELLSKKLPAARRDQLDAIVADLQTLSDRYVHHHKDVGRANGASSRYAAIEELIFRAEALHASLSSLDSLFLEDLEAHIGLKGIQSMLGDLDRLKAAAQPLFRDKSRRGRPPDAAQLWWVYRVADIFERGFGKAPRISGSGSPLPGYKRGVFYELLTFSYPAALVRSPLFSPMQLSRILKTREESRTKPSRGSTVVNAATGRPFKPASVKKLTL
jgi:hypothetical protein